MTATREIPTILVTGVGGGAGQSLLKCLRDAPYRVVAADGDTLGTGLYATATAYRVPYAREATFVDSLLEVCRREQVVLLFVGLDAELPVLARAVERFRETGCIVVVSSPRVVEICDDKGLTAEFLQASGFPSPRTVVLTPDVLRDLPLPMVLKPGRGGARSQGVYLVSTEKDLRYRQDSVAGAHYVAQEYIEGDEYTCGSINWNGRCHGVIVMRRILRDGDTYKAFVVKDRRIEEHVRAVAETLQPFGPCNIQIRVRGGVPYVFEINARSSGTTHARSLAGFNEPKMMADWLLHARPPAYTVKEITILRYWQELAVENTAIATMQRDGILTDGAGRL